MVPEPWRGNAARFLTAAFLALSAPAGMAQGIAANPSAAASDIRNPSSTNPAAAASEIRQPIVPSAPPVLRGRAVAPMPAIRTERRARRPPKARERARAARKAPASPAEAAQIRDAAIPAQRERRTDRARETDRKASGIMGSVCRGC